MLVAMTKLLLVLPANSYRNNAFVNAANELGIELTILTDGFDRDSYLPPGVIPIDSLDGPIPSQLLSGDFDSIIGVDDRSIPLASRLSELLGLPNNSQKAVHTAQDKLSMRRALANLEVPQPKFTEVSRAEMLERAVQAVGGFPVVVKPVGLSQSQGVVRADNETELKAAYDLASSMCHDQPVLVESYQHGAEYALEGIITSSGLKVLAVFDKPEPLEGPYFEESIYLTPSSIGLSTYNDAVWAVSRACKAIGLTHGPIHAEFRKDPRGAVRIIEVAARSIGGNCSEALVFRGGRSLEYLILASALSAHGEETLGNIAQNQASNGVLMLPTPKTGYFMGIGNVQAATDLPFIEKIEITVPIGDYVLAPPRTDRYLGFVFATSPGRTTTLKALQKARELLKIEIQEEQTT